MKKIKFQQVATFCGQKETNPDAVGQCIGRGKADINVTAKDEGIMKIGIDLESGEMLLEVNSKKGV